MSHTQQKVSVSGRAVGGTERCGVLQATGLLTTVTQKFRLCVAERNGTAEGMDVYKFNELL